MCSYCQRTRLRPARRPRSPPGYDEAFLWFSLQDVDGGRAHVEAAATVDETPFLLSALVIELWHLEWFVRGEFRARHLATRDELVQRLVS